MDADTIKSYDLLAGEYEAKTNDYWSRFPNSFLHAFIGQAQGKVLDIGSGPGRDGLIFQYHNLDVTCLDASLEMVRLCKQKDLNASFGDFTGIPFPDESFDAAWAYTSLLHVPKVDIPFALNEIKRVLKRGGALGLGLIEGQGEGRTHSFKSEVLKPKRLFSYFTEQEVVTLLESHAFTVEIFPAITDHHTGKKYIHFLCKK